MTAAVNQLCELSATEARRRIGTKELSPVELLEACIARIEAVNPAINAICATDFARARVEARADEAAVRAGDRLPPLYGLPVGVKDLNETGGLLTTHGSTLHRDDIPAHDDGMVARVRAAGGNIFCKTNTPEFGAGANTRNDVWGATGNPFNPAVIPGGSSGGSAAALATGMMPLATGSDLGGSLRIPAAYCGVVGFRPSAGLVPAESRPFGLSPLGVAGPMARTVADAALLLSAQAAYDSDDPFSAPLDRRSLATIEPIDPATLRVAVSADLGFAPVDAAYRQVFEQRVAGFKGAFKDCAWAAPDMGETDRCFEVLRAALFAGRYRDDYDRDPSSLGPNVRTNYELGAAMTLADDVWAQMEQSRIYRRVQAFFREFDLLITPAVPLSPFPWQQWYPAEINGRALPTYIHWLALTYAITLTGHPACSLPCGVDQHGMPFGIQIVGPRHGDRFTLGVAHALEQLFSRNQTLARPTPDLSRLRDPNPALTAIVTASPGSYVAPAESGQ